MKRHCAGTKAFGEKLSSFPSPNCRTISQPFECLKPITQTAKPTSHPRLEFGAPITFQYCGSGNSLTSTNFLRIASLSTGTLEDFTGGGVTAATFPSGNSSQFTELIGLEDTTSLQLLETSNWSPWSRRAFSRLLRIDTSPGANSAAFRSSSMRKSPFTAYTELDSGYSAREAAINWPTRSLGRLVCSIRIVIQSALRSRQFPDPVDRGS